MIFHGKTPARKVSLYRKLINLRSSDDVEKHINEFRGVLDKLKSLGIKFDEDITAIILLKSLPDGFDNFVVAMDTRDELPSIEILKSKIIEESNRQSQNIPKV